MSYPNWWPGTMVIKDAFRPKRWLRNIKLTFQIWTRGWCDCDCWSLDITLSKMALVRLRKFKETKMGYPAAMTWKEWNEILDKMIESFELICKIGEISWNDTEKHKKINEGLDLFRKYYLWLWS